MQHDRLLQSFLLNLECLGRHGQHLAMKNEAMTKSGTITKPDPSRSHLWEIDLHGFTASGASEHEAICNWKRVARAGCMKSVIEHF